MLLRVGYLNFCASSRQLLQNGSVAVCDAVKRNFISLVSLAELEKDNEESSKKRGNNVLRNPASSRRPMNEGR